MPLEEKIRKGLKAGRHAVVVLLKNQPPHGDFDPAPFKDRLKLIDSALEAVPEEYTVWVVRGGYGEEDEFELFVSKEDAEAYMKRMQHSPSHFYIRDMKVRREIGK